MKSLQPISSFKYISRKAIYLYLASLIIVSIIFSKNVMPPVWWGFGIISVFSFFYFSNLFIEKWSKFTPQVYKKKLFFTAFIIRLCWVIFSFIFFIKMSGSPFEFSADDSLFYHNAGLYGSNLISKGEFDVLKKLKLYFGRNLQFADSGYPIYLSFVYFLTDDSIFLVRLIKVFLSSVTIMLVYKLSVRNFDEKTARTAAIFAMLMPNLIYYTGLHLKETEMIFLTVLFIERTDKIIRDKKLSIFNFLISLALAGSLFYFRTVLGAIALLSFLTTLLFSSVKTLRGGGGKRIFIFSFILLMLIYFMGGSIATEVEQVWEGRVDNQAKSMQWRAEREGGNKFAKHASGAVFAPIIAIIPFPTIVETPGQENQKMLNGGNYVKNILAFFFMLSVLFLFINRKWRNNVLILSFTIGYLLTLALSGFAHSERFHIVALPFLIIIAAFSINLMNGKLKKYYLLYLFFLFIAIIGWSWFKLAGRGMV